MKFFNKFTLETPESVELEFTLAGIGNRAYALVIDFIVLGLFLIILLVIGGFGLFFISDLLESLGISSEQVGLWIFAIQFFIIFATYVGYFVFFETLWQGKTPGKRLAKIRVVKDDGRPIQLAQATLRSLLRPIDDISILGMLFIIFGKKEKRIGDWVAGTIVIQEEEAITNSEFQVSAEAKELAKVLPEKADLSRLLPEDFAVLRGYLYRREKMLKQAKIQLSRKLAHQVKDIIQLEEVPEGVSSTIFLEAVYLAYQNDSE